MVKQKKDRQYNDQQKKDRQYNGQQKKRRTIQWSTEISQHDKQRSIKH